MCFNCKEWGHISDACPEKTIRRVAVASDDACYTMARLDGKLVRAQVDSGAAISLVWSKLIPTPPTNAPTKTITGIAGAPITLPVQPVSVELFDKVITINTVVYDDAPIDLLIGRNCPDFKKILIQAEGLDHISTISTRQQTSVERR